MTNPKPFQTVTASVALLRPLSAGRRGLAGDGSVSVDIDPSATRRLIDAAKGSDLGLFILFTTFFKLAVSRYTGETRFDYLAPNYSDGNACGLVMIEDEMHATRSLAENAKESRANILQALSRAQSEPNLTLPSDLPYLSISNLGGVSASDQSPLRSLAVTLHRRDTGLRVNFQFDQGKVSDARVQQFAAHLANLIRNGAADFSASAADIEMLDPEEVRELNGFAEGPRQTFSHSDLWAAMDARARDTPDAVALSDAEASFSYMELCAEADRIAAALLARGIGKGDRVAVALPRGASLVLAMLGILRSGAAFLPLNLQDPDSRLKRVLDIAKPALVIGDSDRFDGLGAKATLPPASLRQSSSAPLGRGDLPLIAPEDPAYVIFTSGSTGTPKGVEISHRGIANAVQWRATTYAEPTKQTVLLVFPPSFDAFILNLFSPLVSGEHVILPTDDAARDPSALRGLVTQYAVTFMTIGPALLQAMLADGDPTRELESLRRITLAGDTIDPSLIHAITRFCPKAAISNEYGPTENAVVSTYAETVDRDAPNIIGRPIANTCVRIVDDQGRPQPIGVSGEILLAGHGLVRGGYLNATPKEGAPFSQVDGVGTYATGDRARWCEDGQIEFLGRKDNQVSLRGMRVELGEVEDRLKSLDSIETACVFVVGDANDATLAACFSAKSEVQYDTIRSKLSQDLPSYMVPHQMLQMAALPIRENGKYDVALMRERLGSSADGHRPVKWETENEARLAEIWKSLLGLGSVRPDDNFFAAGGHSLKATQLLSRIAQTFNCSLSLREIFNANTLRDMAHLIDDTLSNAAGASNSASKPLDPEALFPVSRAQARMLALKQFGETDRNYAASVVFEASRPLDPTRLEAAINCVVAHHEVLRSQFVFLAETTMVRFTNKCRVPFRNFSISSEADLSTVVLPALSDFDLEVAPLVRAGLVQGPGDKSFVVIAFHHVIIDEPSLDMVLEDVARAYTGAALPLRSGQRFADYVATQRAARQSPAQTGLLDYWRDRLGSLDLEPVDLPYDYAIEGSSGFGAQVVTSLKPEVSQQLRHFCDTHGCSAFGFFLTAVSCLLARIGRQSQVTLACPVSERQTVDTQETVGLLLNTLLLSNSVDSDLSFVEMAQRIGATLQTDQAHAEGQLNDVLQAIGWRSDRDFSSVFNVMLSFVKQGQRRLDMGDAQLTQRDVHNATSKYPLLFEIRDRGDLFECAIEYDTKRFRPATAERILKCLCTMIGGVLDAPDRPLSSVAIIDDADTRRLLRLGDALDGAEFGDDTVVSLFERQVQSQPDAIAIVAFNGSVSYATLNAWANQLAHRLQDMVGRGDRVAVLCDRTWQSIGCMLAAQKLGAAYVPIDFTYPRDRTRLIAGQSDARVLLTDREDPSAFGDFSLIVRIDQEDLSGYPSENPAARARPDDLSYLLFTSGTTGVPKGAGVRHRNLASLINYVGAHFDIQPSDVLSQFHSTCFDVSVWEIFGSLLNGAKMVILPSEVQKDPGEVLRWIEWQGVTFLCQPPSAFYLLSEEMLSAGRCGALRCVVLGGEALKPYRLANWHKTFSDIRLVNGYGTTETTIYTTFKDVNVAADARASASIGRPLKSTYIRLLDPYGVPVPEGMTGEIYIGGLGIGAGYINDAEKTAAKFVQDPYDPNRILYCTNDLAKWLLDGDLVYISRADHQIKIRGYRIETEEIERCIAEFGAIRDVIVVGFSDVRDETRLAAYFVSHEVEDEAALRQHIRDRLPAFMLPSHLIQLDSLPLSPNGKVDRKSLPAPATSRGRAEIEATRDIPKGLLEKIEKIWANSLGVPQSSLDPDANLFDIGGDSITASVIVRQLKSAGFSVTVTDLFKLNSINALAASLARQAEDLIAAVPLQRMVTESFSIDLPVPGRLEFQAPQRGQQLTRILLTSLASALKFSPFEKTVGVSLHQGASVDRFVLSADLDAPHDPVASQREIADRIDAARTGADPVRAPIAFSLGTKSEEQPDPTLSLWVTARADASKLHIEAGVTDAAQSAVLSQVLGIMKFSLAGMLATLPPEPAPSSAQSRRVRLDVEPFNEVFFQHCRNQGLLSATHYFSAAFLPFFANTATYFEAEPELSVHYHDTYDQPELLARLGVAVEDHIQSHDLVNNLRDALTAGHPALVDFDWFDVSLQKDHFQQKHSGHSALVVGFDDTAQQFDIVVNDTMIGLNYRHCTVAYAQLVAGHVSFNKVFNADRLAPSFSVIRGKHGRNTFSQAEIAALAQDTFLTTQARHGASTLAALEKVKAILTAPGNHQDDARQTARLLSFFIGEAMNARKIAKFACEQINGSGSTVMLSALSASAAGLETMRNILLKAEFSGKYTASVFSRLADQAEAVLRAEEILLNPK
ncbi:non-ribosomal peptide synthetase [Phaeobacter sp. B1627]|uniref:non-ribosomal peptide synthetase n=1 Tax=Phaeobacter sp. B1627 TaxID=2583809 RepID=UPI0011191928|nr:non-ribosomal peptide synthetase [Phaeobacter sp. B1627]TNJ42304.1 amino acid adenylation domain-containing protein [Phaeobacter sp. B1627]